MKNIMINNKKYEGVSVVNLTTDDNNVAMFKDIDEITSGAYDIPSEMTLVGTNGSSDVLLSDFFTNNQLTVKSKKTMIIIKITGDTAPTTGNYTLKTFTIAFNNIDYCSQFNATTGKASLVAPSTITGLEQNLQSPSTSYVSLNNSNVLTFNSNLKTFYIPANASVYYAEYPLDYSTGLMYE